ncbi:hypothetical protein [Microbacterium rhizomatis]|uniref:Uncharacterized protein n=1 Tax=Microbacterium rhizomatis TaxID=1631477 RepID=A0A5J5IVH9_9MICO|nr:hypothetical protein [Microbacterium rhizomatis]KAA9105000.1 hypothetical protein F6B43_18300 [Microbacterium rhizomatis]
MNRTTAFICFALLACLFTIGGVLIFLFRPDATATFIAFAVQLLGIVTVGAGTFAALGQQGKKIETIQQQTNGNTSRLMAENERLTNLLAQSPPIDPTSADRTGQPLPEGTLRADL